MDIRCRGEAFVHGKGAFCGRPVPEGGIRPQAGGILWTQTGNCTRLSTQGVRFVDGRCHGEAFVHRRAVFCGCGRKNAPACPHRGCVLWTAGAARRLLSTGGRLYLHQFVLSGAEANFLGILEATFPIGIRMDELEEFVGSIGVVMAAAAAIAFATGV